MTYQELKAIAQRVLPRIDFCCDCGEVLHFSESCSGAIGRDIAVHKHTGETMAYALSIEEGLVTGTFVMLDFETGEPVQEVE